MKIQILCFSLVLILCSSALYSIKPCNQSTYFNTVSMSCLPCPSQNQISNYTECLCKPGFTPSNSKTISFTYSCINNTSTCAPNSIILQTDVQGARLASPTCISSCSGDTLPNSNRSACIYCGVGMSVINGICVCSNSSYSKGIGGCYNLNNWSVDRSSSYSGYIPNNLIGCLRDGSQLECSALINICVYSLGEDAVCRLLSSAGYLYLNESDYSADATIQPKFTLVSYLSTGNYIGYKNFSMSDISNCPTLSKQSLKIGSNYKQSCTFSFNNVLQMMTSTKNVTYMYSLFISDGNINETYSLVPVEMTMDGQTKRVSKFFTADTFSVPLTKQLTVLTEFDLQLTLDSNKRLVNPKVMVKYSRLSINSMGTLDNPVQTLTYSVNYNFSTVDFDKVALPLFIVFSILAIIQAVLRTYIAYLNKRSIFIFFIYFGQNWSSWMFFLLLGLTGYWFFFTKAAAQLNVLLPTKGGLYTALYGVVSAMVIIRVLASLWMKADAFKTDIFLIDWELSSLKNCWRQIFIANSLSEFFTFRTISFGWIVIWTLFFLVGLSWENIGRSNTSLVEWTIFSEMNSILLYFIGCSVMFVVGVIFKILRKVVITWWPHPFDDFVDFCCLANVSVYFPKRNTPVGYYIHGNNSSGSQISLMELNEAIIKGRLRKTNSLFNPGVANSEPNTFVLYGNSDLEYKLSQLRRQQQHMFYDTSRKKGYTQLLRNRENFINVDLKRTLINLPKQRNQLIVRSTVQQYLQIPPVDLHNKRDHIALVADSTSSIQDIFPNADQFGDLITYCIIFGALNVGFKSSAISAFLTYFFMECIVHPILNKVGRIHIQYATKVKQGFML